MASTQRVRRAIAFGAFVLAAAAAPAYAGVSAPAEPQAGGRCLAWLGSKSDGQCISWSNSGSSGAGAGLPAVSVGGPQSGNPGLSTGPLLPGQSWNVPLG